MAIKSKTPNWRAAVDDNGENSPVYTQGSFRAPRAPDTSVDGMARVLLRAGHSMTMAHGVAIMLEYALERMNDGDTVLAARMGTRAADMVKLIQR